MILVAPVEVAVGSETPREAAVDPARPC
jgi:hypothetical protein